MTSKELINKLIEIDPEGIYHVRVSGETPVFLEKKPGYYDGSYCYKDGDKFVISVENYKIDIHTENVEDFIWNNNGDISKIVIKGFDMYLNHKEKEDEKIKYFEEVSNRYKAFHSQSISDFSYRIIKKLVEGFYIVEYKEKVNWAPPFDYVGNNIKEHFCFGEKNALLESGLFEINTEDSLYKYWRLKNGL